MYPETWKIYRVLCNLVILWCCMTRANGDTDTNVDPLIATKPDSNSDLLKILSGILNEKKVTSLSSISSMNISTGSINFNIPFTFPVLNTNETAHKTPIKNIRDDYTLAEGIGYHKFHTKKTNWNNARKTCIDENAHLAVINSEKEERALRQLMVNNEAAKEAYVGAHDMFQEGDWVTISGESLAKAGFHKWSNLWPNEPDNYGGDQNCAVLRTEGGMDDVKCSLDHYYICEIPLSI